MLKRCAALITALLISITVSAQQPDTLWTKTFGGTGAESGNAVWQTTEGGFIIAGSTNSYGAGNYDVYLVKTDVSGDTLWTGTYGGSGDDRGNWVQQTSDGGYIVAGRTSSFGAGGCDIYLLRIDSGGDTLWTRTFGGGDDDIGSCVQQTTDGGYIVSGYTSSFGAGGYDVVLIKTDANGVAAWNQIYGGYDSDYGYCVQQTSDGGYIAAGESGSFVMYDYDAYLIKTDANGDTMWTRNYGGFDWDEAHCVRQTSDGGYILTGGTYSFGAGGYDVYLIKTDSDGDTSWTRTYGGMMEDAGKSVLEASAGGYILTGSAGSFGAGWNDVYIIRTNASGDTLWTQVHGGAAEDVGYNLQQTSDGGYIIAGETRSFGAGQNDMWLIRLDSEGVPVEHLETQNPQEFILYQPHPNPFNPVTNLKFSLAEAGPISLIIYDIRGCEIEEVFNGWQSAGINDIAYDASNLFSGIYFARLTAGKSHQTRKLLLVK